MKILVCAIFGLASVLSSTLACSCLQYSLRDAYCEEEGPWSRYLVQAEVIGKLGPFVIPGFEFKGGSEEDYELFMYHHGYLRYVLDVTDVYRGDISEGQNTLEARFGGSMCGYELEFGKTYVISGGYGQNDANEWVMSTGLCEYHHQYDGHVDVQEPNCPNVRARNTQSAWNWPLGLDETIAGSSLTSAKRKSPNRLSILDLFKEKRN